MTFDSLKFAVKDKQILQSVFGRIDGPTCILGSSGAGKTSLLNILAGRVAPRATRTSTGSRSTRTRTGARWRT